MMKRLCTRVWRDRRRGNGFPLREGRIRWDIGKELFPGRLGRPWHRVPRAAVAAPGSLAVSKARDPGAATAALGTLCQGLPTLPARNSFPKSHLNLSFFSQTGFFSAKHPNLAAAAHGEFWAVFWEWCSLMGGKSSTTCGYWGNFQSEPVPRDRMGCAGQGVAAPSIPVGRSPPSPPWHGRDPSQCPAAPSPSVQPGLGHARDPGHSQPFLLVLVQGTGIRCPHSGQGRAQRLLLQ